MTWSKQQFEDYLALYGTAIEHWPQALQPLAVEAFSSPAYQHCVIEAKSMEDMLSMYRPVSSAPADLTDRIVRAAVQMQRRPAPGFLASLQSAFALLLPNPALALASMLAVGCAIGLSIPNATSGRNQESVLPYADTTGDIL